MLMKIDDRRAMAIEVAGVVLVLGVIALPSRPPSGEGKIC